MSIAEELKPKSVGTIVETHPGAVAAEDARDGYELSRGARFLLIVTASLGLWAGIIYAVSLFF